MLSESFIASNNTGGWHSGINGALPRGAIGEVRPNANSSGVMPRGCGASSNPVATNIPRLRDSEQVGRTNSDYWVARLKRAMTAESELLYQRHGGGGRALLGPRNHVDERVPIHLGRGLSRNSREGHPVRRHRPRPWRVAPTYRAQTGGTRSSRFRRFAAGARRQIPR